MAWYNTDWQYRKEITIDHTQVDGELTDFPVVIHTGSDGDLAANAQSSGDDLLFTAADGTAQLSHEIESYDSSTGDLWAHVKLPSVSSSSDTTLYLYYGNSESPNQESVADVWSNNYQGVWHFNEDPAATSSVSDSSGNGLDGTIRNTLTKTTGKISNAFQINKSDSGFVDIGNPSSLNFNSSDKFTWSAWIKPADYTDVENGYIWLQHERSYFIHRSSNGMDLTNNINGGGHQWAPQPSTEWHHLMMVYNAGTLELYFDGNLNNTVQTAVENNSSEDVHLVSTDKFSGWVADGLADSYRVTDTIRSDAWISTTYTNQDDPQSFHTIGSQTALSPPTDDLTYFPLEDPASTNATLQGATQTSDGISGKGAYLDGDDDYITLGNEPHNFDGDFTLSMWVKPHRDIHTEGRFVGFLSKWPSTGYQAFWHSGGYLYLYFANGIAVDTEGIFEEMPSGSWYHLVFVGRPNTTNSRIYVNGVDVSGTQKSRGEPPNNDAPLTVGTRPDKRSSYNLPAVVDEIRTFDRALSETEVNALYEYTLQFREPGYYGADAYGQSVYGGAITVSESGQITASSSASGTVQTTATTISTLTQQTATTSQPTASSQSQPTQTASALTAATATGDSRGSPTLPTASTATTTDAGQAVYTPKTQPDAFPDTPTAYYPLDNVATGTVTDASGNGHTGVASESVISAPGIVNRGAKFTSDTAEIDIEYNSSSEVIFEDWTVSGWIKLTDWASQPRKEWLSVSEDQTSGKPLDFVHENGRIVHYRGAAAGSVLSHDVSSATGWHHVAVRQRRQGASTVTVELFFDGNRVDTTVGNYENMRPSLKFTLGNIVDGRFDWVDFIDEVRLYNRYLSDEELQALYNTPTGVTGSPLIQPTAVTAQPTTSATPTATSVTGITAQPAPTTTTTAGEAIQTLRTTNTLAVIADATLTELASLTSSLAATSGASAVAAGTATATQTTSALPDTQARGRSTLESQSLIASTTLNTQPRARATATGSRRTNAVFDTVSTGTAQSSVRVTPNALFTVTGSSAGHPKQISKTSTPSFDVFEENVLRPDIQPLSVTHTTPGAGTATVATDGGTKTAQTIQQATGATSTAVTGSTKNVTQLVSADTTTSTEQQTARITHTTTSSSTGQLTTAILSQASSSVNTTDTATGTTRSGPVRDIQLTVTSKLTSAAVAADVLSQRGDSNMRAPASSAVTATTVPIFNSTQPVSTDVGRAASQITADSTVTETTQEHSTTTERARSLNNSSKNTTETGLAQVKPSTGEQTPTQFPSDPLAYYPLDTVSDGTVTDASGNGFDGTHESGVTSIDGVGDTSGAFYDGTTQSVIDDYDALDNFTEFAVSVWIQPAAGSRSDQTIIGTAPEFELIFDGSGNRTPNERSIWWAIDNGTGDWAVNAPTMPPLEINTWHHLLLQQSTESGQVELWVNGEQYVSDDDIGVINDPDGPLKIGARGGKSFKKYTGGVDEVRIYDRALSTAEIQSLYDTPVEPDDEPTQAIFGTTVTTQQQTRTRGRSVATPAVNTVAKTAAATRGSSVEIGRTVPTLTNTVSVTATAAISQTTTRSTTPQADATAHVATQQRFEQAISPALSDTTPVGEQQTLTALTTHDLTATGDTLSAGTTAARTTVQTTPRVPVTTAVGFKSTITPTAGGTGVGTSHVTETYQVSPNTTATGSGRDHATVGTTATVSESDQGLVTPAPQVLPTTIQQATASSLSTEQSTAIVGLTTVATITSDGTVNERLTITRPKQFSAVTDTTGIVTSEQTTAGQPSVTDSAPVAERPNILPVPHTLGALTTTATGTITTNLISPSTLLATDTAPIRSTTQLARTTTPHATDSARAFERQTTDSTAAPTTTDHTEATTTDASIVTTSPIPPTQEHTRSVITTTQSLVRAINLRERGTGITQTSTTHRAQPTATPHARATTQSTVQQPTTVNTSAQGLGTITKTQTQPTTQTAESATTAQSQADAILSQQLTARGNAYAASSTTPYTTTTSPRATDTAPVSTTPDIQIASTTSIDDLVPGLLRRVSLTDVLDTAVGTDDAPRRRPTIITGSRDTELTRDGTRIVVNENERDVIVLDPDR